MRAIFYSFLIALGTTIGAFAHSPLLRTTPANDAIVVTPPAKIILEFRKPVEAAFAKIELFKDDVSLTHIAPKITLDDPKTTLTFDELELQSGSYRANWSVFSSDGHRVNGEFSFHIE